MKRIVVFLPLLIFILLWQAYAGLFPEKEFFFASPLIVAKETYWFFAENSGFYHTYVTFIETLGGFLIGNTIGVSFGLLLWFNKNIADLSKPYLIALGALPVFALAPMTIIWFGLGIWSKIMMAALSTVIIATVQSYQGAINADDKYIQLMMVFKASKMQVFRMIILPSSLLWVFNSIKLNIGAALIGAFIGEFIAADAGIGYSIIKASGVFNAGLVLSGCGILMVMALLMNYCIIVIERKFSKWLVRQ